MPSRRQRPTFGRVTSTEDGSEEVESPEQGDSGQPRRRILCRWCRCLIAQPARGRPREFCKRSCRQREFESRSRAAAHGLDEHQLIVTRSELDELRDRIYVLTCAIQDVDGDLGGDWSRASQQELHDALRWILAAARPVSGPDSLGG
jgi:hypothetical protein